MSGAYKTTWHRVHIQHMLVCIIITIEYESRIYVNPNTSEALWQRIFACVVVICIDLVKHNIRK